MRYALLLALIAAAFAHAAEPVAVQPAPEAAGQPRVEVAFVLDTTGSMGGLIAAAKAKIWYIANQIVLGKPKPIVRMALVPYRDKGDAYVTKVFGLTDNIDEVYGNLMKFKAAGGGDGPENVNQALHDAVNKLAWSTDRKTLKIIYLVGDYPPHNEYKDVPTYDKLAKSAIEKGIYVNTILCGNNAEARRIWLDIAKRAEGSFFAIAQDGGAKEIPTPFDGELARLNRDLLGTAVVYGRGEVRAKQRAMNIAAGRYAAPAAASRAKYAADAGTVASNDLVDDVRKHNVKLERLDKDMLPEKLRKMTPAERKAHVAEVQKKRDGINKKIQAIAAKRADYIKKELAKAAKAGRKAGFDEKVMASLKVQAAKKDIVYK